jgi:hypothetical protein
MTVEILDLCEPIFDFLAVDFKVLQIILSFVVFVDLPEFDFKIGLTMC